MQNHWVSRSTAKRDGLFFKAAQFSILGLCVAASAGAQIRFADRLQQAPASRWDAAMSNVRNGVVRVSRRMPSPASRPEAPAPNGSASPSEHSMAVSAPPHDVGLAHPHWTSSFVTDDVQYPFTVVGSNPSQGQSTTIPTVIIPYRLILPDGGIFDATTDLADGVTPVAGVVNSPLFQAVPWSVGGTPLGVTQFGDAVMRANFWSSVHGNGSGYHVLLAQPVVLPLQTIAVPAGYGQTRIDPAGKPMGVVDFGWLSNTTSNLTVSLGIPPQALAIHLMSAIEGVDINGGGSLGFHYEVFEGTAANPVIQPYIQTAYFGTTSVFAVQVSGTGILGHEIAEWLLDPAGDNYVAPWQDPAQAHVCTNPLLEVGDPLEFVSHGLQVTLNGRSYQFPEVAFLPWFSRAGRSTSVNGWYSSLNTFSAPSAACPVFTNFGSADIVFPSAASTNLTGVNNIANNQMQITGYITQAPNAIGGFVLDFSYTPALSVTNVREVYLPASNATIPVKINDRGQIVGFYFDAVGATHGFLFSNGQYSTIDFPGAVATEALAINNWDIPAIAGNYTDKGGNVHGFVLLGKLFLPVTAGFAVNLSVNGVNDLGLMTGTYDLGGTLGVSPTYGFSGFPGFLTPLNYPGNPGSTAPAFTLPYSLNNQDQVAGQVKVQFTNFVQQMPFLEGGGNFEPILGGSLFSAAAALGNNDAGVLVGWVQNPEVGTVGGIAIPFQTPGVIQGRISLQVPVTVPVHSVN